MAKLASISLILTISCLLAFTLDVYARKQGSVAEEAMFLRDVCQGRKGRGVQLHFYVHDFLNGHPNSTVFEVAKASITDNSPTGFGRVRVLDDPVTEGPDVNSRRLGRIQGIIVDADMSTFGVELILNIVFTVEGFTGSTLSIFGRNEFLNDRRELPVVGGTGYFRNTRGYAIQTTYISDDGDPNHAVLEYTCYITVYNDLPNIDVGIIKMHEME